MLRALPLLLTASLLAACAAAEPSPGGSDIIDQPLFTARGQEPGWLLTIGSDRLVFLANYGQQRISLPLPQRQPLPNGYRYAAASEANRLRVDVVATLCQDTMSGMPYPAMVTIDLDSQRLDGCGGAPEALLQGEAWTVEWIGDSAVLDGARPTLTFGTDGRVSGNASCNSFGAGYRLTGEGLSFTPIVATRRACVDANRMQQESAFLDQLGRSTRFDIRPDGALLLETATSQTLLARRP